MRPHARQVRSTDTRSWTAGRLTRRQDFSSSATASPASSANSGRMRLISSALLSDAINAPAARSASSAPSPSGHVTPTPQPVTRPQMRDRRRERAPTAQATSHDGPLRSKTAKWTPSTSPISASLQPASNKSSRCSFTGPVMISVKLWFAMTIKRLSVGAAIHRTGGSVWRGWSGSSGLTRSPTSWTPTPASCPATPLAASPRRSPQPRPVA
jgi:hypothetical protein